MTLSVTFNSSRGNYLRKNTILNWHADCIIYFMKMHASKLPSYKAWADAHVAACEARFDLRVREFMHTSNDLSPAALLEFASSVPRLPADKKEVDKVKCEHFANCVVRLSSSRGN